jgi:protein TonB
MFEDSTFESKGRIRTRSRFWMIATLTLNGSILLALILIPLIYPEALPRQAMAFLMAAPPPEPTPPPPAPQQPMHTSQAISETRNEQIFAPPTIPRDPFIPNDPEPTPTMNIANNLGPGLAAASSTPNIFPSHSATVVHSDVRGPMRVSSGVIAAMLLRNTNPVYPTIAKAAGVQGTVTLQAMISKSGTIENLRVVSGPPMLQQAAMEAVKTWVYQPYLLDGQPVEVETTVNVIFSLGR